MQEFVKIGEKTMKLLATTVFTLTIATASFADTWTVDDDGKADFNNIQDAVDAASDGDEILVMPGTYTSTSSEVVNILGKEITLRSVDGHETTTIDGENVRRGILCDTGETEGTVIDGFTIWRCAGDYGAGMKIDGISNGDTSPTVQNCFFSQNVATGGGGAIFSRTSSSKILECIFKWNSCPGQHGGAIYTMYNSSMEVLGCTFYANTSYYYGGAIYGTNNAEITILNCDFSLNSVQQYGGAIYLGIDAIVNQCSFVANDSATRTGGAIAVSAGGPVAIQECVFSLNTSFWDGAAIAALSGAHPTYYNSTFCNNSPSDFYTTGGGTVDDLGLNEFSGCPGSCCVQTGCSVLTPDQCDELGGTFLTSTSCLGCPTICTGDLDTDGDVDIDDLLLLIGAWGVCP
jgi:predicted outer membrane repeat protein